MYVLLYVIPVILDVIGSVHFLSILILFVPSLLEFYLKI